MYLEAVKMAYNSSQNISTGPKQAYTLRNNSVPQRSIKFKSGFTNPELSARKTSRTSYRFPTSTSALHKCGGHLEPEGFAKLLADTHLPHAVRGKFN